jgi:hypothetical protein
LGGVDFGVPQPCRQCFLDAELVRWRRGTMPRGGHRRSTSRWCRLRTTLDGASAPQVAIEGGTAETVVAPGASGAPAGAVGPCSCIVTHGSRRGLFSGAAPAAKAMQSTAGQHPFFVLFVSSVVFPFGLPAADVQPRDRPACEQARNYHEDVPLVFKWGRG